MARSAKRRRSAAARQGLVLSCLSAAGSALSRNPGMAGGVTAFLVAFSFVSANALWYQTRPHEGAFFATRGLEGYRAPDPRDDAATRFAREAASARDPLVADVQTALAALKLYSGPVDGIAGPRTRQAVEEFQRVLGVKVSGGIDEPLLAQLRAGARTAEETAAPTAGAAAIPEPHPSLARDAGFSERMATASVPPRRTVSPPMNGEPDPDVVRLQAGLKAFGNDGIQIDGVIGARTKAAIREFQELFGLPVTGEPDERLYAKMQEVGLTN